MRHLHICQPTTGGAAAVVTQLVRLAIETGDEVVVACPSDGDLASEIKAVGATWVDFPMRRIPQLSDLRSVQSANLLMEQAQIVHLHSSKAGAIGRVARRLHRSTVPTIFIPHGWSWYVGGSAENLFRIFERRAAHWCDSIVTVSQDELLDGIRTLGSSAPLLLIENGVDPDVYKPVGPIAASADTPLLVCVGRLCRQKGQDLAIRALSGMTNRSVRLRLLGDGPDEDALRQLAHDLGVAARVEFIGSVDPRPHVRAADVVVQPSRWEGLSLALLESMSMGAAIVATAHGSRDALGDAGVVISDDLDRSVTPLSESLDALLLNDNLRDRMGAAARDRILAKYYSGRTAAQYRRLWAEVAAMPSIRGV